jgi:hypothetical protein
MNPIRKGILGILLTLAVVGAMLGTVLPATAATPYITVIAGSNSYSIDASTFAGLTHTNNVACSYAKDVKLILAQNATAGTNTIVVTSIKGIKAPETVTISDNSNSESTTISSINGTTLTLASNLANSYVPRSTGTTPYNVYSATTYKTFSGVPVSVLMAYVDSGLTSTNYNVKATSSAPAYYVVVGPTSSSSGNYPNINVEGNNNLIVADQDEAGALTAGTLASPQFTAGKAFNSSLVSLELVYNIAVSIGSNGAITPSGFAPGSSGVAMVGIVPVSYQGSQAFTITGNSSYYISSGTTDTGAVTVASYATTTVYTFSNVIANHTLAATFAALPVTSVSISAPASETSGATFDVSLNINTGSTPIRGWQGGVNFDQTKLHCNSVSAESFLTPWATGAGDSILTPAGLPVINNTNGTITNFAYGVGGTANLSGPSGSGTLVTISFTALANGTASITPASIVLSDVNANTIPNTAVTVGSVSIGTSAAEITAYNLPGEVGSTNINSGAGTIGVNVPFGTNVSALAATFTLSTGASATVGATTQNSGVTTNNFTSQVTYTVTAQNLSTTKTWTVTVTVLPNAAAEILTYSLPGELASASINSSAGTIAVSMPAGADLTAVKASFTISTGASVKVGSTPQVSGSTANDFSSPVAYTVTAQNLTTKTWTVTVTIGGSTGNSTVSGTLATATVSISVPSSLSFGNLKSGWNVTDWTNNGSSPTNLGSVTVTPGSSGVTSWTVTAQGGANMMNGGTSLTDPLLIGPSNGAWSCADGTSSGTLNGSSYSGMYTATGSAALGTFNLWAAQYGASTDSTPGSYSITITFTATCTP